MIDTSSLPLDEAKEWHDAVGDADFFNLPTAISAPTTRDAFTYQIAIDSDEKQHSVAVEGGDVPSGLSRLIDRLRQASQLARGNVAH
jgi:hypothetical protein